METRKYTGSSVTGVESCLDIHFNDYCRLLPQFISEKIQQYNNAMIMKHTERAQPSCIDTTTNLNGRLYPY